MYTIASKQFRSMPTLRLELSCQIAICPFFAFVAVSPVLFWVQVTRSGRSRKKEIHSKLCFSRYWIYRLQEVFCSTLLLRIYFLEK